MVKFLKGGVGLGIVIGVILTLGIWAISGVVKENVKSSASTNPIRPDNYSEEAVKRCRDMLFEYQQELSNLDQQTAGGAEDSQFDDQFQDIINDWIITGCRDIIDYQESIDSD